MNSMASKINIVLDITNKQSPLRTGSTVPRSLPPAPASHRHTPKAEPAAQENAILHFIGNATTVLEWEGIRLLTDPNFLHAGDHVHLGPGVQSTRLKNPAVELDQLPGIDVVLLSHYHADHFDEEVENALRRDLPIVTTEHAKTCLTSNKGDEAFTNVHALDPYETLFMNTKSYEGTRHGGTTLEPCVKLTAMPGKHVPSGVASTLNDLIGAVPPTNGWMLELGYDTPDGNNSFKCGYRIYITGDTLMIDELKEIPHRYKDQAIDLMLIHLGGTTIPGPSMPLLMVTMDAKQGIQLMQLIKPDLTIPIHFDDYDVMLSSLDDFKAAVKGANLTDNVLYLDRGDAFYFNVKH